LALAAGGRGGLLKRRIRRILSPAVHDRPSWRSGGALASLLFMTSLVTAVSLGVVESTPVSLADEDSQPQQSPPPTEQVSAPKTSQAAEQFTPVRQSTLSLGAEDAQPYLDWDSGRLFAAKEFADAAAKTKWIAENGIDVELTRFDGKPGLQFHDVYAVATDDKNWDTTTPEEMRRAYREGGFAIVPFERFMGIRLDRELPITIYLANVGLLQVTQRRDGEPLSAMVRYKLLASPAGNGPPPAAVLPRGLEFLQPYPEFHQFRLGQDEATIRRIAEKHQLTLRGSAEKGFVATRADGETLALSMREGKCVGIQRLGRNPADEAEAKPGQPAPNVVRQIFAPTTRGSNKTSWTGLFRSRVAGNKEYMMMVHAHRGDRWPVKFAGQEEPLLHGELVEGNDDQVEVLLAEGDRRETLKLQRDQPQTFQAAGREFRISYSTTQVEGRESPRVDHATLIITTKEDEETPRR
jgi:hypothetical protein